MTNRAILIAAGRGSRLEHHTDSIPKCKVKVAGRSILDHQLAAFLANGIDDFHVIRGYLADKLTVPGASYYENDRWEHNNILHSLFYARDALHGPLLTTYSDIVFSADVVARALQANGDINLIVDRKWAKSYQNRHDHPVTQAELVEINHEGHVLKVGKQVGPENALGEFIGLASFSARGVEIVKECFDDLCQRFDDDDVFRHGRLFRKAYLADLFEAVIDAGHTIHAQPIDGGWREIDTVEDLKAVNRLLREGSTLL